MTLDDLELYTFEFSENFSGFRRLSATTLRGFVSDSWAFLYWLIYQTYVSFLLVQLNA